MLNDLETCPNFSKANLYLDSMEVSLLPNKLGDVMQNFSAQLESISKWVKDENE